MRSQADKKGTNKPMNLFKSSKPYGEAGKKMLCSSMWKMGILLIWTKFSRLICLETISHQEDHYQFHLQNKGNPLFLQLEDQRKRLKLSDAMPMVCIQTRMI